MNILAFDTSTSACSVALYIEDPLTGGQTFSTHEIIPKQHTLAILPMIQSLFDSAGITIARLDAIAFGCGPGSFTGIRIAASLAQGLAYASSLPVIPISSLSATAQAASMQHGWQHILVAVDARMSQVYWGAFNAQDGVVSPVFPEEIADPASVQAPQTGAWCGVGDGWRVYPDQLISALDHAPEQIDSEGVPSAEAILILAKERYRQQDWVRAAEALPVYLR